MSSPAVALTGSQVGQLSVVLGISEEVLIAELHVTRSALRNFWRILQEHEVPPDELDRKLREFAARYRDLREKLQQFKPDDPALARIYQAAAAALDEGNFARAEQLLNDGSDADLAAARAAQISARDHLLSAAAAKARNGDLKRAQLAMSDAVRYYRQSLDLTPQDARDAIATNLVNLGSTLFEAGEYPEAGDKLRQALSIQESLFAADDPRLVSVLNWMGLLCYERGRFVDAEQLHRRALAIEEAQGGDRPGIATQLDHIANALHSQGKSDEAEQLLARALAVNERLVGPDHTDIAYTLLGQAVVFLARARYNDAEAALRRAIDLLGRGLGPEHPDLAAAYDNLATVLDTQGRFRDSGPLRAQALQIRMKFDPTHPSVARSLTNIGLWHYRQDAAAEALPFYRHALDIQEKRLGLDHVQVGTTLHNTAMALLSLGRFADAEPLDRRALAIKETTLGPMHPEVAAMLVGLAAILEKLRRFRESDPMFERALAIREAQFGPDHPEVATSLYKYAMSLGTQRRYREAEPVLRRALAIRRTYLPDHPETLELINNLATNLMATKQYREAEALLLELIGELEGRAPASTGLFAARLNYAEVLRQTGRNKRAGEVEKLVPPMFIARLRGR